MDDIWTVQPEPKKPTIKWAIILLLGAWAMCFLSFHLLWFILIPSAMIFGLIFFIIKRRIKTAIMIFALNPLTLFMSYGVFTYITDVPVLSGNRQPLPERYNIDPNTRCFRATHRNIKLMAELWLEYYHDITVKALCSTLGPPPYSYEGPYPNETEAIEALKKGTQITLKDFRSGSIPLPDHAVRLNPQQAFKINRWILGHHSTEDENAEIEMIATLWKDRCLIIQIKQKGELPDDSILLIDTKTTRPFAVYRVNHSFRVKSRNIRLFWH